MHSTSFTPLYKKGHAFMRSLTREHIESLAEKKLHGTITPGEQALLDQWLNQEPEPQMIWNSNDADESALRKRLLKRIKKDAGISNYSSPVKRIPVWRNYRWSAAVILLLIAGSLSYFLLFKKGAVTEMTDHKKITTHDIAPGHNGAILTLAHGNKIVLDSAGNGKIAMQGNRRLVKKNGQLVYEKAAAEVSKNSTASDDNIIYNTLRTPRGRKFQIVLSDGTKVWLNAASSITYPTAFTGKERKVTVTGEVYFEVAPHPPKGRGGAIPFIVHVNSSLGKGIDVKVLGTHFNINAYNDEASIKTTLLEGAIKVSHGHQHVIITPGQQASVSRQSDQIVVATVDTEPAVAWVEGKLSLNDLGVGAIMRKVSRWYDVDVEFEGPVPQEHFWGLINREVNLSAMLKVMRASGIDANLKGNKVIVSSDN